MNKVNFLKSALLLRKKLYRKVRHPLSLQLSARC